jgi:hypothetical protein
MTYLAKEKSHSKARPESQDFNPAQTARNGKFNPSFTADGPIEEAP